MVLDRAEKLQHLSKQSLKACEVHFRPAAPLAAAVDTQRAPHSLQEVKGRWLQHRRRCHLNGSFPDAVEIAVCRMLQVYWINSPFHELSLQEFDMEESDGFVILRSRSGKGERPSGLWLPRDEFVVEARGRQQTRWRASYHQVGEKYQPYTLEYESNQGKIVLEDLIYEGSDWNQLKSFWISVGSEQLVAFGQIEFTC